jgi:hypothetical protein
LAREEKKESAYGKVDQVPDPGTPEGDNEDGCTSKTSAVGYLQSTHTHTMTKTVAQTVLVKRVI